MASGADERTVARARASTRSALAVDGRVSRMMLSRRNQFDGPSLWLWLLAFLIGTLLAYLDWRSGPPEEPTPDARSPAPDPLRPDAELAPDAGPEWIDLQ